MIEEKDIRDFANKDGLLETMERYRMQQPISDVMYHISERSALYLEFLAGAFIKETGLKASECELVSFYSPIDNSFHWKFRKI